MVAREQRVRPDARPLRSARLLERLADTRQVLTDARERLLAAPVTEDDTSPATEWLLDNYYVVQEQLEEVRASLPGRYYRELPELANGPLTGFPRVYEMAISLISHTEARIDLQNIGLYVDAFQSVTPLSIGELWALPVMLRMGLIESIRRMTLRSTQRLDEQEEATRWAQRILNASLRDGSALRAVLREFAVAAPSFSPHVFTRLLQILRRAEGASPPLLWIEQFMRESGQSPEQAVGATTERMALTQLMMANSITSLRRIGRIDWRGFVEAQSAMDLILRADPADCYPQMTFETRDLYRHAVERIAKGSGNSETAVAQWAVDLARTARVNGSVSGHVGFYLVDDGLTRLEEIAGYAPTVRERFQRAVRTHSDAVLVVGIALCTALAVSFVLLAVDASGRAALGLVLLFALLPAIDLAVGVFNHLVTLWLPPRVLSRMDFHKHGVPADHRTAVVVPTLFEDADDVRSALDNLEVQYLANREAQLVFAVLSDFTDASAAVMPGDDEIVRVAGDGIRELNSRYGAEGSGPFLLLHRAREWNAAQGVWMGWERKRGKLAAFNRLLRGDRNGAFPVRFGDATRLDGVRYVITLDSDTVLPPDAAPALIGAMAHPLNRPVFDDAGQHVIRGYGILQPQVGVSPPSAHYTRFAAISSGHPGVDPYAVAASDVYQDLFGEGSFTGKGIYDVDAFQQATHGRFPENVLLSHDLLEGNYARAGLATDVIVYDDYPSTYVAYARRKHRWMRGDWQLLPWLKRTVPGPDGPERNRLSLVSQWKILDNLRRSTVELTQLVFLLAGWTVLPGSPLRWTLLAIGAVVAPWVMALVRALAQPPFDKSWRAYYGAVGRDAIVSAHQAVLAVVFLPHQALLSADAIVRTLYRLLVSRRHLLDWQSASLVERRTVAGGAAGGPLMRVSTALVVLGAIALGVMIWQRPFDAQTAHPALRAVLVMSALFACWLSAPYLARELGRTARRTREHYSPTQRDTLHRYAATHWQFFARFLTAETHWLAPDNFQASPEPVVAMRTSPTNIGLQLLATISAHDLDLVSADDMTHRLEQSFATLQVMRTYRGHFYNWYDLHDLRVLEPAYISTVDSGNLAGHLIAVRQACLSLAADNPALHGRLVDLADQAFRLVQAMDFSFLYDDERELFTIGYHPDSFTPDDSYYDLLASEARLASFVAIAKDDVPLEHWFRLSRALGRTADGLSLVSWSGSMFEYLMPVLVMRSLPDTLLDATYRAVVERHRDYARMRRTPWGVSESAYNVRDRHQTYQYRAFGIPDLALKRGLGRDMVVAPYATALATMVEPLPALANLETLEALGALGDYGFCDALDYTRPDVGREFSLVEAYMAHHIGMTLVSLTNVLLQNRWQDRFHDDPLVKSAELLLHERVPRRVVPQAVQPILPEPASAASGELLPVTREIDTLRTVTPRVALLGAAPYTVMVNHSGSGYSRYGELAVTRWSADSTSDDSGQFFFLKDMESGKSWSATRQPLGPLPDRSRAILADDRVTWVRSEGDIDTITTVSVVPGDAAEVRCVTITNSGRTAREIEITSYAEVVMAPAKADRAHPAFSKLFIETEWHAWCNAITATRRPRTPTDQQLWCVHVVNAGPDRVGFVSCETDRARFIGRGRSVHAPVALDTDGPLSGTTGPVLDPILSLRTRVHVRPGHSVRVAFTTLVATSRDAAFALADRYHDPHTAQRAFDIAWSAAQIEQREPDFTSANAALFQDLATQVLLGGGSLAPPVDELRRNRGSQPMLWAQGISGDLPIVLATIDATVGLPTLRDLFLAHRYWRRRGLMVDLVIINAQTHDYLQELRDGITETMVSADDAGLIDQPGGVFVRRRDAFSHADYLMLSASARVHVPCDGRTLSRVLAAAELQTIAARALPSSTPAAEWNAALASVVSVIRPLVAPLLPRAESRSVFPLRATPRAPLRFDNGVGGMSVDDEYCIAVRGDHLPPAPWANVIANPHGGFLVSERGGGCMWAENAYFFRVTPWHNDPVSDPPGDVIFLQELDAGDLWSATPAPVRSDVVYDVQHAAGCTTFAHERANLTTELTLGMPDDAAVKVSMVRLHNRSGRTRRLVVTAYAEWTLGAHREDTRHQITTRYLSEAGAIVAQNHFDPAFSGWTAYLATSEPVISYTADRRSFLGPQGHLSRPAALALDGLDLATGAGLDPCAALQMRVVLAPGESKEFAVLLGAAPSEAEARTDIARWRSTSVARQTVDASRTTWRRRLDVIRVATPISSFDTMVNTWSLYQTLACRVWARMGPYQSSGAFGFRDQLQDVLALVYAEPALARAHIVRAAARQFLEGDVQHWWHAHTGRGVRTRFSDDLVWLPYVVDRYVRVTGDASVLDDYAPFLNMKPLDAGEHERYDLPAITDEHGSIYEHCRRALRRACTHGAHGLPLIGTGDWNDGFSLVGAEGRGESVWLAWFLITTLRAFATHADARGDLAEAAFMRAQADQYVAAVESRGWDGAWYRRAFYDDGTPMGSATSDDCRIDSIAQSWAVISGAAQFDRQAMAMRALDEQLVDEKTRLIRLLTPPFDRGAHNPGYIKGYVPGVRENGAQYTHAALWAVQATALQGRGQRAFDLFQMLNPLTHTDSAAGIAEYKVEPFVVAADVYTAPSQRGRGGWTWYTGSASWMYRIALEQLLGFTKEGNRVRIEPCVPDDWPGYAITYRWGTATYEFVIRDPAGIVARGARYTIDGRHAPDGAVTLVDDGAAHSVIVDAVEHALPSTTVLASAPSSHQQT